MLTVYDKIQNACHQLNSDAYSLQIKNKKRLRQFLPCEKSLVLLACLREDTHFGMAIAVAARTKCNCHNALTEEMLWSMCFDDTAKKRHYGEERHLTPLALDGAIAPDNQQVLPADVLVGEGTLPEPPRQ